MRNRHLTTVRKDVGVPKTSLSKARTNIAFAKDDDAPSCHLPRYL